MDRSSPGIELSASSTRLQTWHYNRTMGTVGLLCVMIENQLLSVDDAFKALDRMKSGKRRLPWTEAEKLFTSRARCCCRLGQTPSWRQPNKRRVRRRTWQPRCAARGWQ